MKQSCIASALAIAGVLALFVFFLTDIGQEFLEEYPFLGFLSWMIFAGVFVFSAMRCYDNEAAKHGEIRDVFRIQRDNTRLR